MLVALEALFGPGVGEPRPERDVSALLDRLGGVGEPVILIGSSLLRRQLPSDPADRIAWVGATLGRTDLALVEFEEPPVERLDEEGTSDATERWRGLADAHAAAWLITGRQESVAAAHRAGLAVILVGPRSAETEPAVARADHEARDLRDAVNHVLVSDVFPTLVPE